MIKYTKLAQNIVYSSMWEMDGDICKIWITLLALKDQNGMIDKNITGIARIAKQTVDKVEQAVAIFESPDPNSSSQEEGGRRLKRVGGGWLVVNHQKYLEMGWSEEKKAYERERKAKWRAGKESKQPPHPNKQGPPKSEYHKDSRAVLHYLNEASGRNFREVDFNLSTITARLNEDGVDFEGVKMMIDRQVSRWGTDPKLSEYLRPETLFGKQKFDGYYAARDQPVIQPQQNGHQNKQGLTQEQQHEIDFPDYECPRDETGRAL